MKAPILLIFFTRKRWIGISLRASLHFERTLALPVSIASSEWSPIQDGLLLQGVGGQTALAMLACWPNSRSARGALIALVNPKEEPLPARRCFGLSGHERN